MWKMIEIREWMGYNSINWRGISVKRTVTFERMI